MIKIKKDLTTGPGYIVLEKIIPDSIIDSITEKLHLLHPVRASSSNKKYAERDEIKNLPNISVWWSQMVTDWPEVIEINKLIHKHIITHLENAELYSSDIVTIEPHCKWINPHIDTPHRFKEYNYDRRLLGIQSIVALVDMDGNSAGTGVVPKSQNMDFNINLCYKGLYDQWFKLNCVQPKIPKGSVLFYNCRVMHSSMPNPLDKSRPALLLNYLDRDIIEEVKKLDNIWTSNGN